MYVQDRNPGHTSFLRMYKTTPCFDVLYFEIKKNYNYNLINFFHTTITLFTNIAEQSW